MRHMFRERRRAGGRIYNSLASRVHGGMRLSHFSGLLLRFFDLHQRTFPDPRTIACGLLPLPPVADQFRPEWENAALCRLRRVNRAAARLQEMTLRIARHAQPQPPARPVDVLPLELGRCHPQEVRHPRHVGFGQVDESLLSATFRTSRLAVEAQPLDHPLHYGLKNATVVVYFR
jgi:hypothetical protein